MENLSPFAPHTFFDSFDKSDIFSGRLGTAWGILGPPRVMFQAWQHFTVGADGDRSWGKWGSVLNPQLPHIDPQLPHYQSSIAPIDPKLPHVTKYIFVSFS